MLSQVQLKEERVIAYASKTQQRYCTTYRELLAVVTFVKHFRHYLWGRKFIVRSDLSSLKWTKNFKNPEGMVARWLSVLSTYDFVIEYRRGSVHTNADAMSRKLCRSCKNPECLDCKDKMSRSSKVLKTEDGLADKKDTKVSIAFQAAPVLNANQKDSHGHERQTETASLRAEHDELIDSKGTAMPVVDHINCVAHVDAENSAETRTHDSSSDFNDSNWVHTWTVDQIKHWQS